MAAGLTSRRAPCAWRQATETGRFHMKKSRGVQHGSTIGERRTQTPQKQQKEKYRFVVIKTGTILPYAQSSCVPLRSRTKPIISWGKAIHQGRWKPFWKHGDSAPGIKFGWRSTRPPGTMPNQERRYDPEMRHAAVEMDKAGGAPASFS